MSEPQRAVDHVGVPSRRWCGDMVDGPPGPVRSTKRADQ
jgi:hypothetical protein